MIGSELIRKLITSDLCILTRNINKAKKKFKHLPQHRIRFLTDLNQLGNLNGYDAVINLAGEPIINKRWSPYQKALICRSRWDITRKLVSLIHLSSTPPSRFISGSAIGYYGDQGSIEFDETLEVQDSSFSHGVCEKWESIALSARGRTRVCLLRTGVVASSEGGMLARMLPFYKLGLGGVIGNGEQYLSWIHIDDVVRAILFLIEHDLAGPFNISTPHPVRFKEFTRQLAFIIQRPHFLSIPQRALKIMMGESSHLLLASYRAKPRLLLESGFTFRYPTLKPALRDLLERS